MEEPMETNRSKTAHDSLAVVTGIYKPQVCFRNPFYNPLKCSTVQILLELLCSCDTGAQSQPKQIFLSPSALIPEVSFCNPLGEQHIIFRHTHCPHTSTYAHMKCLKYMPTGNEMPFLGKSCMLLCFPEPCHLCSISWHGPAPAGLRGAPPGPAAGGHEPRGHTGRCWGP